MKRIFSILTLMLLCLLTVNQVNAQKTKPFQGTITYDITYNSSTITPAEKAQLPTSETTIVKDCKTKIVTDYGQATVTIITDGSTKTYIQIVEYMGDKYAIKDTIKDSDTLDKEKKPVVKLTQETKVISGYTCKKAILTSTSDDGDVSNDTIYFSEDIGCKDINFMSGLKNVNGVILEATQYAAQLKGTVVKKVKEIKKEKISDTVFMMPADAKEMTKEEFKKTFGGE